MNVYKQDELARKMEGIVDKALIIKGDVNNLKYAKAATRCLAVCQAKAQRAAHQTFADGNGSLEATGTGAAQDLQPPPQPLLIPEARSQQEAADHLWRTVVQLREDFDSKDAELTAVLASLEGSQQPASGSFIESFSDLLLQYRDLAKKEYLAGEAYHDLLKADNIKFAKEAKPADRQQQKGHHRSCCRKGAVQNGGVSPSISQGRVHKRSASVAATAERIARLHLCP